MDPVRLFAFLRLHVILHIVEECHYQWHARASGPRTFRIRESVQAEFARTPFRRKIIGFMSSFLSTCIGKRCFSLFDALDAWH